MKVSIITATYNSAATVQDTIDSVINQTYHSIEHIVVDGNSTDDTMRLVRNSGLQGKVVQEEDEGIYDALNKGIAYAEGEIIGILHSDDFYPEEDIIQQVADTFANTGADVVYGDLWYVHAGDTSKVKRKWVAGRFKPEDFLYGWMPPHPSFFVRREVYEKYGAFDLRLWGAADYELMLRFLYKHQLKAAYLPKVLVHMRAGGQSNQSIGNRLRANLEDRKAWKMNGLSPRWFTLYLKPIRKITQFL